MWSMICFSSSYSGYVAYHYGPIVRLPIHSNSQCRLTKSCASCLYAISLTRCNLFISQICILKAMLEIELTRPDINMLKAASLIHSRDDPRDAIMIACTSADWLLLGFNFRLKRTTNQRKHLIPLRAAASKLNFPDQWVFYVYWGKFFHTKKGTAFLFWLDSH